MDYLYDTLKTLSETSLLLKTDPQNLVLKVDEMLEKLKLQEREIESLKQHAINDEVNEIQEKITRINGINVLAAATEGKDMDQLRKMSDLLRQKMESGIMVLGSIDNDKVVFICAVTKDLVKNGYHAGKIIKEVAQIAGGGGGGRPDFAQAGGKNPDKLGEALDSFAKIIKEFE